MYWYLAKIVFQVSCERGGKIQFDEQLRLIQAEDEFQAYVKAQAAGLAEEERFADGHGKQVSWLFVSVSELKQLDPWSDGMMLHSTTEEPEEADSYRLQLRLRGASIRQRVMPEALQLL
jgi:hypothetical protein